ncbi:hypothetical protein GLOTRDRAFT_33368, partial [Gloeophyllum trabeum ATCC 11539]
VLTWTLPIFAIAVTLFRLWVRARKRQLGWDDFWAMAAVICFVIFISAMELHFRDERRCSKLSILFTTIRLTAPGTFRRWLIRSAFCFGCAWAVLFSQVFWVCENQPGWKDTPQPQCDLGRNVAIAQVITDVATDAVLIGAPLKLIWKVKLTRTQKIRIFAVFSTTTIATAVSLYHSYAILRYGGFEEARAAVIQDGVSLIVADLSVIVAFFMQISSVDDSSAPVAVELVNVRKSGGAAEALTVNVDTSTTVFHDYQYNNSDLVKVPLGVNSDVKTRSLQPEEYEEGSGMRVGEV